MPTTTKNAPPAGTKTHKPDYKCPVCAHRARTGAPRQPSLVETLRADISALTTDKGTLERQVLQLTSELEEKAGELRLMQNTIQQSVQGSQAREKHVATLESKLSKAEGALLAVQSQLTAIGSESAQLIAERDRYRGIVESIKADFDAANFTEFAPEDLLREVQSLRSAFDRMADSAGDYAVVISKIEDYFEGEEAGSEGENLPVLIGRALAERDGIRKEIQVLTNEANLQRRAADEAKAALKMAHKALEESTAKSNELILDRGQLQLQVQELTPLLPAWVRVLFALVLACAIAAIAHRSGVSAGTGGAR